MKRTRVTTLLAILVAVFSLPAGAQGFPGLGDVKLPKPSDFTEKSSKLKKLFGAGTGCVVGGAIGYSVFKTVDDKFLEKGHTEDDVKKMGLIAGGIGCVIGGKAAIAVIERMDEKSKKKQEEAWAQAIANGGNQPVRWEGPKDSGYSGTVNYEKAEPLADGAECITRKDYVIDGAGQEATAYNRYCKNGQNEWERIEAA